MDLWKKTCEKCGGKKIIKEKDGTVHVCWDCLAAGEMDQHTKNLKDSGIKL